MDAFFRDQMPPPPVDGDQQQQQQEQTSPSAGPNQNSMSAETIPPSAIDTPMMGMNTATYGGAMYGQNTQDQAQAQAQAQAHVRRHSVPYNTHYQSPFSAGMQPNNRLSLSSADMSMLGFTGVNSSHMGSAEDAFRNFPFAPTNFAMSGISASGLDYRSIPSQTMPTSGGLGTGSSAQGTSAFAIAQQNNPFSTFQSDTMDNMMDFSGLEIPEFDPNTMQFYSGRGAGAGSAVASTMSMTQPFGEGFSFAGSPVTALPPSAFAPDTDMNIEMDDGAAMLNSTAAALSMGLSAGQSQQARRSQEQQEQQEQQQQQQQQQQKNKQQQQQLQQRLNVQSGPRNATVRSSKNAGMPTSSKTPTPTPISSASAGAAPSASSLVAGPRPSPPGRINQKNIKNYYSASGFDMIRALYYVSSRPNPEVSIGPVDFSCAFVVCDATLEDYPIIYISDNFQHLTGYSSHEILGQNCRFLQAPDGRVQAGARREFTDNKAVYNIKQRLLAGREVQQSLINYRKGGKPFLNLLTMIPIPWDDYKDGYKYFIGLQIDLVESPDAISGQSADSMHIDYKHRDSIPQHIWGPPISNQWLSASDRTLGMDDVSALLQQYGSTGLASSSLSGIGAAGDAVATSDLFRQSWDKMLLENVDDVVHVLSLKGVFLYLSPSCKTVLEYDTADLVGNSLSSICHPSDIVPVTREMRDTQAGQRVNFVFRVRRKRSGYTWFESYGSLLVEQGKGRKCIVLVGRKRPAFALHRNDVDVNGGIGDSEIWTKMSTSGMVLHVSSNVRSLLDLQPDSLAGTSMQDLMRKESRVNFNRALEKVRRGIIASCRHEVQHRRGQVLHASTILYPGDSERGEKPTFVLGQTRLLKSSSSRNSQSSSTPGGGGGGVGGSGSGAGTVASDVDEVVGRAGATGQLADPDTPTGGFLSSAGGGAVPLGSQDAALAADNNIFDELKTTRCTSWQYELRQMEKANRLLAEELGQLLASRKKRKRRKGVGNVPRDCANCHTRNTPEWRRGPSGQRDLCNSCGLRWAKQVGRVSPRNSSRGGNQSAGSSRKVAVKSSHGGHGGHDGHGGHGGHSHSRGKAGSNHSTGTTTTSAATATGGGGSGGDGGDGGGGSGAPATGGSEPTSPRQRQRSDAFMATTDLQMGSDAGTSAESGVRDAAGGSEMPSIQEERETSL